MPGQDKQVIAEQGLSSGKYKDRLPDLRDSVNQADPFRERQLIRRGAGLRNRATMRAAQVAALGELPIDETGCGLHGDCPY